MAQNWRRQPRGKNGRWWADERKTVRLHLRLSDAAIDRLLMLESVTGLTKTEVIETALTAYTRPQVADQTAPRPSEVGIFARHAQQLARRRRRR